MVFRTCTATATLLRCAVAPRLRGVQSHGIVVGGEVVLGVERTYNLIIEYALVVVHVACVIGVEAVEVLRQLGQVVGTAGLVQRGVGTHLAAMVHIHVGVHAQHLCVGLAEHLAVAHTAHGVAVAALYHAPEVLGNVVVVGVAVATEAAQRTRDLGDMLVGVACAYVVDIARQGLVERR